ncbi:hypothetical protein E0H64_08990 [Rhizobium leguminosarum bv. viciae]|nr:hypothetical protein E0H64_08990 [Rhizobium leguminosarum bv. viciae]TBZ87775.1 hypothetical protein E0H61_02755 [Rhizobium leguminosarum bv. viciae]
MLHRGIASQPWPMHVAQKCARFWDNDMHQILHVAQKCVRFWENDMHPIKPLEFSACEAIFCARR